MFAPVDMQTIKLPPVIKPVVKQLTYQLPSDIQPTFQPPATTQIASQPIFQRPVASLPTNIAASSQPPSNLPAISYQQNIQPTDQRANQLAANPVQCRAENDTPKTTPPPPSSQSSAAVAVFLEILLAFVGGLTGGGLGVWVCSCRNCCRTFEFRTAPAAAPPGDIEMQIIQ